jgi:hypothetical protein
MGVKVRGSVVCMRMDVCRCEVCVCGSGLRGCQGALIDQGDEVQRIEQVVNNVEVFLVQFKNSQLTKGVALDT